MSLVECRECGIEVSDRAKKCPHCGISDPGRSKAGVAVYALVLMAVVLAIAMCSNKPTTAGAGAERPNAEWLRQHGGDPEALDHRFGDEAQAACSVGADDFLRSIAAHDFAWDSETEGFFGNKFDKISTNSVGSGLLTLISTRAKLSNGFGSFTHINLYCLYDANQDKVVSYSQNNPALDVSSAVESPSNSTANKSPPIIVYTPPNEVGTKQPANAPETASDAVRATMSEDNSNASDATK